MVGVALFRSVSFVYKTPWRREVNFSLEGEKGYIPVPSLRRQTAGDGTVLLTRPGATSSDGMEEY